MEFLKWRIKFASCGYVSVVLISHSIYIWRDMKVDRMAEFASKDRILIILLHAYTNKSASMIPLEQVILAEFREKNIEIKRIELPISILSLQSPSKIAETLVDDIDKFWAEAKTDPFTRIIFVGHSVGSLIARKAYVIACGETDEAPFEREIERRSGADWAPKVDRIILLAGMNRGWRVSHHLSLTRAPLWWLGSLLCRFIELITGKAPLIMQVRLGATFITQLRIQWLRMRQRAKRERDAPGSCLAVQLLGSIDDHVSPKDNIDLVAGGDFIYLDVPYSGHANVIDTNDEVVPPGCVKTKGQMRRDVFAAALMRSATSLASMSTLPDDSDAVPIANEAISDVIFVVHGIRDAGYWTHKVARAIRSKMPNGTKIIATETSSYGYFPMFPFLFSGSRRVKVEWLMDRYATAIASYPNAERFHFVGHSNGTYCLAEALRLYTCCKFDNIVFAGSVIRQNFEWNKYIRDSSEAAVSQQRPSGGSVSKVLNFTATRDWVVAIFPKLFQTVLPIQRLGSAGHDGFKAPPPGVAQIGYVVGGHSAAIAEPIWPVIAEFITTGEKPALGDPFKKNSRVWWVYLAGCLPWAVWLVLLGLVSAGGICIFPGAAQTYQEVVARLALFVLYVAFIIRVVTWL